MKPEDETRWRTIARRVIQQVMAEHPGLEKATLRKVISAAYPFGERRYFPYKTWLDEVKVQLGEKPPAWDRTRVGQHYKPPKEQGTMLP